MSWFVFKTIKRKLNKFIIDIEISSKEEKGIYFKMMGFLGLNGWKAHIPEFLVFLGKI